MLILGTFAPGVKLASSLYLAASLRDPRGAAHSMAIAVLEHASEPQIS
jgi:hypothetical protein